MDKYRETPIFQKSEELLQTLRTIMDFIPEDNGFLLSTKEHILENIYTIQAKLAGAHEVILWDIKMENAALIRKCARELMVLQHSLKMFDFAEVEYYKIVRRQLDEFRQLFREWVATFDPKHFVVDEWGLFNPPGIPQDYEQSDDELDFLDDDDDDF
ncbi:hypothetical protein [Kaistella palustris]|uniref:hypothetical protein n=1 Tax=Kaistella palustris TaxID=493376 RepID=UPI0003FC01FC|nr:hypothetical protein [Kaistella palustris]